MAKLNQQEITNLIENLSTGKIEDSSKTILVSSLSKMQNSAPWQYQVMKFAYHHGGREALKGTVLPSVVYAVSKIPGFDFLFKPYQTDPEFNIRDKTIDLLDLVFFYNEGDK